MSRFIRDYAEFKDGLPLSELLDQLLDFQWELPSGSTDVVVRLRGDDFFGRRISISYLRPQTREEIEREGRNAWDVETRSAA